MAHFYMGNMDKAKLFHALVKEGYDKSNESNYLLYETVKIDISIELRRREGTKLYSIS